MPITKIKIINKPIRNTSFINKCILNNYKLPNYKYEIMK